MRSKLTLETASWSDMKGVLDQIVLIAHPKVKRRWQMFTCSQNSKESIASYIARICKLASVAHLDGGLTQDQLICLAIICGIKDSKWTEEIFKFFRKEDDINLDTLTQWAESLITQQTALSNNKGDVHNIRGGEKCAKCKRRKHTGDCPPPKFCDFCKSPGHLKDYCYLDPKGLYFRKGWKKGSGKVNTITSVRDLSQESRIGSQELSAEIDSS